MSDDNPNARYGENTIEGAFLSDITYCLDNSDEPVTVSVDDADEHNIQMCHLTLDETKIGSQTVSGVEYPVEQMQYQLTVPVDLDVSDGDDVVVDGFEATWTFTDVTVLPADYSTKIRSDYINKSYGDSGQR